LIQVIPLRDKDHTKNQLLALKWNPLARCVVVPKHYQESKVMQSQQQRHVLVITGVAGKQPVELDAAAYSIGRDQTNAIVLDFETVSRQHAILLRVPEPETNSYKYCLVDGNAAGKASTNGIYVNGERCSNHDLMNGDVITFGRKVQAFYLNVSMAETEFSNYLQSLQFQSIKSKQVSPKATLAGVEQTEREREPMTVLMGARSASAASSFGQVTPAAQQAVSGTALPELPNSPGRPPTHIETLHDNQAIHSMVRLARVGLAVGTLSLVGVATIGWLQFNNRPAMQPVPTQPAGR
jgi:pSer/pThr/pTyr-binding forkhead associated (FHA) protein